MKTERLPAALAEEQLAVSSYGFDIKGKSEQNKNRRELLIADTKLLKRLTTEAIVNGQALTEAQLRFSEECWQAIDFMVSKEVELVDIPVDTTFQETAA